MISNIGRVLTVLVAMFSVAFMAFAISRWATIPDWVAEAREMEDFQLSRTEGETPTWTAVTRLTGDPVASATTMPEVLEKMYQRATQDARAELDAYEQEIPYLEEDIAAAEESIEADIVGVKNRVEELIARLDTLEVNVAEQTSEAEREKAMAQKLQLERERRRADVFRLREQLAQLQVDQFRAGQMTAELTDKVRRLKGSVSKLAFRQLQLKQAVQ